MQNLNKIIRETQPEKLVPLMDAPETKQLFSMLSRQTGENLENIAEKAVNGDTAQLTDAIKQLMQNPESAQLIQQIKSKIK